jgi:hypothetical protein
VTARRDDALAGYVDTSAGRIRTHVTYQRQFRNTGQVSDHGLVQSIDQRDRVAQTSVSTRNGRVVRDDRLVESYPVSVDFSAASYVNDQNFSLQGTVHMGQDVASVGRSGGRPEARAWTWVVDSTGVLSRTSGVTSESDGHSRTSYAGTDDLGRPYYHRIVTQHGLVVTDVER